MGHIEQICGKFLVTFRTIFYISLINLFISSKGTYFLCTTDLNRSHKNQPLLFALGGWLEEKKNRPKKIEN